MSDSLSRSSSFSLLSGGMDESGPPSLLSLLEQQQGPDAVLQWAEDTGQVSQALRTCLEQMVARQRPLAHKRVCAQAMASILARRSTQCAAALLQQDVRELVQHLMRLPGLSGLTRSTQLCLLLLLCSLQQEEDMKHLVLGSAASVSEILGLCTGLMGSRYLSYAAEAAVCLLQPLLPLISSPEQAKQAAAAVVQLLRHCAEAAWTVDGEHEAEAAQHTSEHTQLSCQAAHAACLVLQALLSSFPAEATHEVMAGRGAGALVKLMGTSCAAAASGSAGADLSLQIVHVGAASLGAVMLRAEEEAVQQIMLSGGCRVLLALMSDLPAVSSGTSRMALHMLSSLQRHSSGRDELVAMGGLPQLAEWAAAEPGLVVRALHCFSSSTQASHVGALSQCQPALAALVQLLGNADPGISRQSLQALVSLVCGQPTASPEPEAAPADSAAAHHSTACSPELATRLLETSIMQQLEAQLCDQHSHERVSQALSIAAALAASSEAACTQVLSLQQQQQHLPRKTPSSNCLCATLSAAVCLASQHPHATQLLLHVLQQCSNHDSPEGLSSTGCGTAWVQGVAAELFSSLPEKAAPGPDTRLLQVTAKAWSMLGPDACSQVIPDDPSSTRRLVALASQSHDPAALQILCKAAASVQAGSPHTAAVLESISPMLERALLDLAHSRSNSVSLVALSLHCVSHAATAHSTRVILSVPVLRLCCFLLHASTKLAKRPQQPQICSAELSLASTVERVCAYLLPLMCSGHAAATAAATGAVPSSGGKKIEDTNLLKTLRGWMTEAAIVLNRSKNPANQDAMLAALRTVSAIASSREQEETDLAQQLEASKQERAASSSREKHLQDCIKQLQKQKTEQRQKAAAAAAATSQNDLVQRLQKQIQSLKLQNKAAEAAKQRMQKNWNTLDAVKQRVSTLQSQVAAPGPDTLVPNPWYESEDDWAEEAYVKRKLDGQQKQTTKRSMKGHAAGSWKFPIWGPVYQ